VRAFIAIDITDDIRKRLVEAQKELPDINMKKVEPENLHISLKFLGNIDDEMLAKIVDKLKEVVGTGGMKPFAVTVKGVGFFPNEKFIRVAWAGCESEEEGEGKQLDKLGRLGEEINRALAGLGFSPEPFTAHLTLARAKNKVDVSKFRDRYKTEEFGRFTVSGITVYESVLSPKGPAYLKKEVIKIE